jgi:hypothetical protein
MQIDTQAVLLLATKWNFFNFKPGLVGGIASVLIRIIWLKSPRIRLSSPANMIEQAWGVCTHRLLN